MNSYRKTFTLTNASQAYFADNATGATITLAHTATPDGYAYKVAILNNGVNNLSGITIPHGLHLALVNFSISVITPLKIIYSTFFSCHLSN